MLLYKKLLLVTFGTTLVCWSVLIQYLPCSYVTFAFQLSGIAILYVILTFHTPYV